jgi:hypothetical protein
MTTKSTEWNDSRNEFAPTAPDPVITYDHMEQDTRMKIKPAGVMPVWYFLVEEITIIALVAALYLFI